MLIGLPPEMLNQFTASGAMLLVMGGVMAYMKSVPQMIWLWFKRQVLVSVTVKDDDPSFLWVKEWITKQKFMPRVRRVDLDSTIRGKLISLMPAPGEHFFWHKRLPFWLNYTRSEDKKGGWDAKRSETISFSTIGRRQERIKQFVTEIIEIHKEAERSESKLYVWDEYWIKLRSYSPRTFESVVLDGQEKEKLLQDVNEFLGDKERYRELGIPYHRGYAFYGPPGTGKTSLASGLAYQLSRDIYLMNLGDLSDKGLKTAISTVPEGSIIMFEDIDASGAGKKRKATNDGPRDQEWKEGVTPGPHPNKVEDSDGHEKLFGVTLSGLLNVLDGFHAPSGVIYIMTTNHLDNLDPALIRPGRIDVLLHLGQATDDQKIKLYQRFYPEDSLAQATSFVKGRPEGDTMAQFQGALLTKRR